MSRESEHRKKKIAPIVITVIMVIYYAAYFGVLMVFLPAAMKMVFGIVPLVLAAFMIVVCIQRLKEIDEGEEDDLSKY